MSRQGPSESSPAESLSPLDRSEYIEQQHLFAVLGERMKEQMPAQEVLASIREEILATTKLPIAIDFLLSELKHAGEMATGMKQLGHYFTPFQCFLMSQAEDDQQRFDLRIALDILAAEAGYRAETATRQGLFLFQLEVLCRNRLGYDLGLEAVACDPSYPAEWREWILIVRRQIGITDLADLLYVRSAFAQERRAQQRREQQSGTPPKGGEPPVLLGVGEGRIAWANRRKEPLLLFAALHRHLGYPEVPRPVAEDPEERLLPMLARRVEQLEQRLKLVEQEQRGGIDLSQFYVRPDDPAV